LDLKMKFFVLALTLAVATAGISKLTFDNGKDKATIAYDTAKNIKIGNDFTCTRIDGAGVCLGKEIDTMKKTTEDLDGRIKTLEKLVEENDGDLPVTADTKDQLADYWNKVHTPKCKHDAGWTYILEVEDEDKVNDIPDSAFDIAAGFKNKNGFYVGNDKLRNLGTLHEAEICVGNKVHCKPTCHKIQLHEIGNYNCDLANGAGPHGTLANTISQLAGVCLKSGAPHDSNQKILKCLDWNSPKVCFNAESYRGINFVSNGHRGSGMGHGVYYHWSGDHKEWHTWGCGFTYNPQGLLPHSGNHYAELGTYAYGCEPSGRLDLMQLRVKPRAYVKPSNWKKVYTPKCKHDDKFTYVFDVADEAYVNDIPDLAVDRQTGWANKNGFFLGVNALAELSNVNEAEICIGSTRFCKPTCMKIKKTLIGNYDCDYARYAGMHGEYTNTLAQLAGVCLKSGAPHDSNQKILKCTNWNSPENCFNANTYRGINFVSNGHRGSGMNHGVYYHWSGNHREWHTWGCGFTFNPEGLLPHSTGNQRYEFGDYAAGCASPGRLDLMQLRVRNVGTLPYDDRAKIHKSTCPQEKGWNYIFELEDMDDVDDVPDVAIDRYNGWARRNSYFMGVTYLRDLKFTEAEICVGNTRMCAPTCHKITKAQIGNYNCDYAMHADAHGTYKNTLAQLAGVCLKPGAPHDSNQKILKCNNWQDKTQCFNAQSYRGINFVSNGHRGSGMGHGVYYHWSGNHREWHTWGCGVSYNPDGLLPHSGPQHSEFGTYAHGCMPSGRLDLMQLRVR